MSTNDCIYIVQNPREKVIGQAKLQVKRLSKSLIVLLVVSIYFKVFSPFIFGFLLSSFKEMNTGKQVNEQTCNEPRSWLERQVCNGILYKMRGYDFSGLT